eukprot:TRINITY_DN61727_c0_g1_i1.p1 TRINITY_DN61727_c0_g1~~TRINITY_DN61727_c0_g1_i1.p1  ORF type:complete len:687 (+),score=108.99 TRINITY_DN61727_c0_g1_i1:158-2218(+)
MAAPAGGEKLFFDEPESQRKEMEVVIAEMETRLRASTLRILRPVLDKTADTASRLEDLAEEQSRHAEVIHMAEHLRTEVQRLAEYTQRLQGQTQAQTKQVDDLQMSVTNSTRELNSSLSDLERRIVAGDAEHRKQDRVIARIWEETARLQQQQVEASKKIWAGIDANAKVNQTMNEEVRHLIFELEQQRDLILQELFDENKSVSKLRNGLTSLELFVKPLPELDTAVSKLNDKVDVLREEADDCARTCADVKQGFNDFKNYNEKVLDTMRGDFRHKSNELTAHHASLMKTMRADYENELKVVQKLRGESRTMQAKTDSFCQSMAETCESTNRVIEAVQKEIRYDMQELNHRRTKDRLAVDSELKSLHQLSTEGQEFSQRLRSSIEFIGQIVGLVLEGERVASAMSVQEYFDRANEKWLTLPRDLHRSEAASMTANALEGKPPRTTGLSDGIVFSSDGLAQVDFRKGFHYDEYRPGQVTFGGVAYSRRDILLLHHKLLQKAHEFYTHGPEETVQASVGGEGTVSLQPSARGGTGAGKSQPNPPYIPAACPLPAKLPENVLVAADELRSAKSTTSPSPMSGGSRQRHGSHGQPQALGSRGASSAWGLGETEPVSPETSPSSWRTPGASRLKAAGKAGVPPLRLPSIVGDAATSHAAGATTVLSGVDKSSSKSSSGGSNVRGLKYFTAR